MNPWRPKLELRHSRWAHRNQTLKPKNRLDRDTQSQFNAHQQANTKPHLTVRKEVSSLHLRLEGFAYRQMLKDEISNREQISEFWSGAWNKKLLIQPDSLKHLSRFIEYKIKTTQQLFHRKKNAKDKDSFNSDDKDSGIPYNKDSMIAWSFFQWLLISKNKRHQPIPKHLPLWLQSTFCTTLDFHLHVLNWFNGKNNNSKLLLGSNKIVLNLNTQKKLDAELNSLKSDFSKALSEGLLTACLEEESQQIIFGRVPSQTQIQELFTTTNLLLEFGNHLGIWELCFINSIILPFHETNPFADENEWKRALRFEKTLKAIESAHAKNAQDLEFLQARVITSLMIDSYILDETLLEWVLECLNEPASLQRIAGQQVVWSAPQGKSSRLVFISPTTDIFYRQYLKACLNQNKPFELTLRFPGKFFYQAIGLSKNTVKLETFKSWKHSVSVYLQLKGYLDGMSLAYVTGTFQSHSLLPKVLNKYFNLAVKLNEAPIHAESLPNHGRLPRSYLWSQLRAILDVKHITPKHEHDIRQGIKQRIKALIANPDFSNNEALLAQYALARIDKSHGYEPLSPTSILGHIDAIGLAIILSAEDLKLLEVSATQRQAIYLNAADLKEINPKRFFYFLKLFEDWYVKYATQLNVQTHKNTNQTKKVSQEKIPDYDEIFADIKRPEFSVDATILSFEEYQDAKNQLIEAYIASDGEKMALLQATILLILGFKLDLRRSEAIYLQNEDYIFDPEQPNLFIKPHEKRSLKTNNAIRMFHLEEHLDSQEMNLMKEYLNAVERLLNVQDCKYLFPDKKTTPCPPNRILDPLLKVLRQVSNDPDFKFHNLRHSKASWDMLGVFNAQFELKLDETVFKHMPKTAQFLSNAKNRWSEAVHTQESLHKAPFYLHRQMGHGSLLTTLKNYIHTLDFALAGLQQRQTEQRVTIEWASLLGVGKKSTLYREFSKQNGNLIDYLLESILPWSTFDSVPHSEDEEPSEDLASTQSKPSADGDVTEDNNINDDDSAENIIRKNTLLPRKELQKWQAFRHFEIFHYYIADQKNEYQQVLDASGMTNDDLLAMIEVFKQHKALRLKMPVYDVVFERVIDEFLNLPEDWQAALLDGGFVTDGRFEPTRGLITHTLKHMSIKLEDTKNPLSLVKEVDILCSSPDNALPIITLLRALNWEIKCRFMRPENEGISWQDWQRDLGLEDEELNASCVVKAPVKNKFGRLTIRLRRDGKSQAKHFERYLLLVLIFECLEFRRFANGAASTD